jgi:hypothetical protein
MRKKREPRWQRQLEQYWNECVSVVAVEMGIEGTPHWRERAEEELLEMGGAPISAAWAGNVVAAEAR